ncbi:MAG: hypothetical protein M1819_005000 [Sarea resinae]|nr:MAG: hypothetical protein M1819_005000 [Sarea resinae]
MRSPSLSVSTVLATFSLLLFLFLAISSASLPPKPGSHEAVEDLICHETSTEQTCYPRLFHPTTAFQHVHPDQEIPPGLHVRLNLETGQREARLNVPGPTTDEEESQFPVLVGPSTDDAAEDESPSSMQSLSQPSSLLEKSGKTAPAYSNSGRIPQPPSESLETDIFSGAVDLLHDADPSKALPFILLNAFDDLEDLAHSLYWGLRIASSETTTRKLLELLSPTKTLDASVRANAALVLGSALQNNPSAIEAFVSQFSGADEPLSYLCRAVETEPVPRCQSRLLYLLFSIARDKTQLHRFLHAGGLDSLRRVFDADRAGQDREKDAVRGRIATFISDEFLEDDAAATIAVEDDAAPLVEGAERESEWVLLDPSSRSQRTKLLQPWCATFATALKKWISSPLLEDSNSEALERVQHAHLLLKKNMRHADQKC